MTSKIDSTPTYTGFTVFKGVIEGVSCIKYICELCGYSGVSKAKSFDKFRPPDKCKNCRGRKPRSLKTRKVTWVSVEKAWLLIARYRHKKLLSATKGRDIDNMDLVPFDTFVVLTEKIASLRGISAIDPNTITVYRPAYGLSRDNIAFDEDTFNEWCSMKSVLECHRNEIRQQS